MSDIFISYAHEDRETARKLASKFDSLGWGVWWDRTILAGETFDELIEEELDNAHCVIVIWSEHSVGSRWVRSEAEEAARRKVLVPVIVDQVKIPLAFRRIQAENMSGWDGSPDFRAFVKLKAAIEHVLGPAPAKVEADRRAVELQRVETEQRAAQQAEALVQRRQQEQRAQQSAAREPRAAAAAPAPHTARAGEREPPLREGRASPSGFRWLMALGVVLLVGSLSWFAWDLYTDARSSDAQRIGDQEKRHKDREAELQAQLQVAKEGQQLEAKLRKEEESKAAAEKESMARKFKEQAAALAASAEKGVEREPDPGKLQEDDPVVQATVDDASESKALDAGAAKTAHAAEEDATPGAETVVQSKNVMMPKPGTIFRDKLKDGSPGPQMVVIPQGSFSMGKEDGGPKVQPVRTVSLSRPFALGRHEVTFAEFDLFAQVTGRKLSHDKEWGRGERPVINVSWKDSKAYTEWLTEQTGASYRLPSEAEWEYAARANSRSDYWWGNRIGRKRANCDGCRSDWDGKLTAPVGSFEANGFGLTDTVGNVWEWVQDCWHANYTGAPSDGTPWLSGDCSMRVIRGGSWQDPPILNRSTIRLDRRPEHADYVAGFRLCREL